MLHIAILEPERALAEQVMTWLTSAGHRYTCCSDIREFVACLTRHDYDLLLVDCGGREGGCLELLELNLDTQQPRSPLLFVTDADNESAIIRAFERGADDYVVKPLLRDELLSRISVLHRRFTHQQRGKLLLQQNMGPFQFDFGQRTLSKGNRVIVLTEKDFSLAAYLFSHQNELLSRHRLLADVWGVSQDVNTRTVDMHISRLRKALSLEGSGYEIKTVHQHGYRLEVRKG